MKMFASGPARNAAAGYSVIDNELTVSGDVRTQGTIRVDGRVEGSLHRADTLIIGAGGTVVGDIEAREVVIGGELRGNLTVSERVEVQATATVTGDIRAAAVHLLEGGKVHGHISIKPLGAEIASIGASHGTSNVAPVAASALAEPKLSLTPSNRAAIQG